MITFETLVRIERPVEEVFAYLAEPLNFPRWNSAVHAVRKLSADEPGRGSTYLMERRLPVGRVVNELEVTMTRSPEFAIRTTSGVHVALEARALPAAQRFTGDAWLDVCPAFRLPPDVRALPAIEAFVRTELGKLGLMLGTLLPLGGSYAPTIGATPEQVTPFVAVLEKAPSAETPLAFEPLAALHARINEVLDGHLKLAVLRLMHALGG